jgi:nucleotide-binding universal stress UspA family protein
MATSQATLATSFKTILFATDLASSSEAALPYLLSIARLFGSTVIAAHAVPFEALSGLAAMPPMVEFDAEWREALQAMRAYEQAHPFSGLNHKFVLEHGPLREVIEDLAAQHGADLIVLGTHGRQGFHKLFAGSYAEEIFRTITCPILIVGPNVDPALGTNWKPRRILFATEFEEGSRHAIPCALALADAQADAEEAKLTVMHAVPLVPWEQQSELDVVYQQRLHKLIPEGVSHRCKIDFAVEFDLAAPGILSMADEIDADLIVMGVHHARLPRIDAHVPGTTASEVIANARCPVLTVCG